MSYKPRLNPIALALLSICPSLGMAQTPEASVSMVNEAAIKTNTQQVLDEITVTGSKLKPKLSSLKTASELRDIPQSISIVSKELIETQGAISLADALRNVSGLTLASGEGGVTGDSISIRGFSARSDMYQNGIKDNGQFFRDSFNLEQVEVYKGASSMLFGRGGTGGVVNTKTKQADGEARQSASISQPANGGYRATADFSSEESNGLSWRTAVLLHNQDSFRENVFIERNALAPSLTYKLSDNTAFIVDALIQKESSVLDYGLPYNLATSLPVDVSVRNHYGLGKNSFQEYDVSSTSLILNHSFSDSVKIRNMLNRSDYTRHYRFVRPNTINEATPTTATMVSRIQAVRGSDQENVFNQTDINIAFSAGTIQHKLSTGLEWGKENYTFRNRSGASSGLSILPAIPLFHPQNINVAIDYSDISLDRNLTSHTHTRADSQAIYLVDQAQLSESMQLVIGVRRDRFDAESLNILNGDRLDRVDHMTSGRAGLILQPSEHTSFYLGAGTAFNPSAEGLSLSDRNANTAPEETRNIEIGSRLATLDGHTFFNIALYQLDKVNARTIDPANTNIDILDGRETTDGIELELIHQLNEKWMLRGGASWMDARIVNSNTISNGIAIEGKRPRNAPEFSASAWTTYKFPKNIETGIGLFHVDERYADSANKLHVPAYTRADAYLNWQLPTLTLALNVYNLSDQRYFEHAHPVFATPGAPRTFSITARLDFK